MTVHLITGSIETLEQTLLAEVATARQNDPLGPVTIVTGSVLLRPYLRNLIARHGGHANLRIRQPGELIRTLTRQQQPGPVVGRYVMSGVAKGATGYFAPVAETDGFVGSLIATEADLYGAEISPDDLEIHAGTSPASAEKILGLATLQRGYLQRLRDLAYRSDVSVDPGRFSGTLVMYGLWQPTRRLLSALDALVRHGISVTVLIPAVDGIFAPIARWAEGHAANHRPLSGLPATNDLSRLQGALFSADGGCAAGDGSVVLVSAPDPMREAMEAARACLRWAGEGIPFGDMAVIVRSQDYQPLIRDAFATARVPVYRGNGVPLTELPAGRRVVTLLRVISSQHERPLVLEFLAEAAFPPDTRERYTVDTVRWDTLAREAGILEGLRQWRERLSSLQRRCETPNGRDRTRPEDAAAITNLIAFLVDLDDAYRLTIASWTDHLAELRKLVATYVEGGEAVLGALEPVVQQLQAVDPLVDRKQFLATVLRELERPGAEEPVETGEFGSGVALLDVISARNVRFRAVAVLGLIEGAFPPSPSQDALLLDEERAMISADLPLRASGPDPEPALFLATVQGASDRLQLSYARSNEGKDRLPSYFFRQVASVLHGSPVLTAAITTLRAPWFRRVAASRFGPADIAESLDLAEYDRTLTSDDASLGVALVSRVQPSFKHGRDAWYARWQTRTFTTYDGVIDDLPLVAATSGIDRSISPTTLEHFGQCPHRFLMGSILRLKKPEDRNDFESVSPLDRGSFVHEVLDVFMRRFVDDPPARSRRVDHLTALREIAVAEWLKLERDGRAGAGLLSRADFDALLDDLFEWYDEEVKEAERTGFRPVLFEQEFGYKTPVDVGGVRFRGYIDRIDRDEHGRYRVIDYKTGKAYDEKDDRLQGGKMLQLPVYIYGAASVLDADPLTGEAQYFYTSRRGNFDRRQYHGPNLGGERAHFPALVAEMKQLIQIGAFPPKPGEDKKNCRLCDFSMSCDSQIDELAQRKQSDERAQQVASLEVRYP